MAPRIARIHALAPSVAPIHEARATVEQVWGLPVLTAPDSAVRLLRLRLASHAPGDKSATGYN